MGLRFIITSLLWLLTFQSNENDWNLIWSVSAPGNQIYCDNLGYIYVVNGDQMLKLSKQGNIIQRYSNKSKGKISRIDVQNPLKILVFYKDFSQIVFLDNTLSENGSPIYMDEIGLEQVTLACSSYGNGFWLFDPVNYNLIRFNQNIQETVKVSNLSQLLGGNIDASYMIEYENNLFMNDKVGGILQFDNFGSYVKTIPVRANGKFRIINDRLYYTDFTGKFNVFGTKTLQEKTLSVPIEKYDDWQIESDRLYILASDSLRSYSY